MLALGFSAGIPLLLLFGTLSVWLNEAGVNKSTITFFSWAGLGYSFKFVWAPLIDQARLPLLTRWLGKRRAWLLLCQVLLLTTLALMACVDPSSPSDNNAALTTMALLAVCLGFLSASQDIVIDALRIEMTPPEFMGLSSASYQFGYRLAMIVSGAGAFRLAMYFGSTKDEYHYSAWQMTYWIMALMMLVGIVTTLLIKEPTQRRDALDSTGSRELVKLFIIIVLPFIATFYLWNHYLLAPIDTKSLGQFPVFLLSIARLDLAMLVSYACVRPLIAQQWLSPTLAKSTYVEPVKEFFSRYPKKTIILLLLLIGFYRVSDLVLGAVANMFYQDLGFTKAQFGDASKIFGLIMTIVGTFFGGALVAWLGTMRTLFWGAVLSAITNLLFMWLANEGNNIIGLYGVICLDNLAAGIATTAFITLLSRLSNLEFTAMQYAIFSSIMLMLPTVMKGYSGTVVSWVGYPNFFLITTLIGLPVIFLVNLVSKELTLDEEKR
ncbi:MAG: MFS transporter [Gammaproteobacteria bacterium]|nr:MAG: MFS transporter [Gammaproteobacteria bacterium]